MIRKNSLLICLLLGVYCIQLTAQDSLNMEKVGQWNPSGMPIYSGVTYNDVWGYTASDGTEYGILGNVDSIIIINISIPSSPIREYAFYGGGHAVWRDFKIHSDYLYAVCDGCSEGMHIFDLSALPLGDVSHIATVNTFFAKAHNIFIDTSTQKLYAAGTNTANKGLVVLDISTPDDPVLMDNHIFDEPGNFYVHDLYVKSDTAYCSHGNQGYYVWDMTDLNQVVNLGSYDSPGYNHSSWIGGTGQYAYYAEEVPIGRPMAVMDLNNLGSTVNDIQLITTFKDPISNTSSSVTPHNPFVKDDTLYISYYEDGIKLYDLSDPISPELIGYYDTYSDNGSNYTGYKGAWGSYPFLPSGHILVSDIKYGLNIIKLQACANPTTYFRDRDEDGFGNPNNSASSCSVPAGYVTDDLDCDDTNSAIHPNGIEVCDNVDNDCDGLIDMADPDVVPNVYYRDLDNDDYGDINNSVEACTVPNGYVTNSLDCDDSNNMVHPEFPEICDGIDNDCDGLIDQDDSSLTSINWYLDNDGDGIGNDAIFIYQCEQPNDHVPFSGDCDDSDLNNYPGNNEVCDGQDNNCDGIVDENCPIDYCDGVSIYVNPIAMNEYRAEVDISSDAISGANHDISFYAGQEIDLMAGFEIVSGTSFLAAIEDCILTTIGPERGIESYENFILKLEDDVSVNPTVIYIIKSEFNSVTKLFEDFNSFKSYAESLRAKNQSFKLYVFKNGELIQKLKE